VRVLRARVASCAKRRTCGGRVERHGAPERVSQCNSNQASLYSLLARAKVGAVTVQMTCVWDGLIKGLVNSGRIRAGSYCPRTLATYMRTRDPRVLTLCAKSVTVNGSPLTCQQLDEMCEAVREIDPARVSEGYMCSTFDPLLIAVCGWFRVSIAHLFLQTYPILYRYTGALCGGERRAQLNCVSTSSHFALQSVTVNPRNSECPNKSAAGR